MKRVWAILLATLKEGTRSQVFFNLLVFGIFAVLAAQALEQLSLGERGRALWDSGLALLSATNALLGVALTVRTMGGEEDRHSLLTVLVRPVRRAEVLLGKYLGVCSIVAINTAGAGLLLYLSARLANADAARPILLPLAGLVLEASLVTVVTLLFTTFAGTTVAAVMGMCVWLVGLGAGELRDFAHKDGLGALQPLMEAVYFMVPNLQRLDFNATPPSAETAAINLAYGVMYAAMVWSLAALVFERRDLK